jgi:hypothetical protein
MLDSNIPNTSFNPELIFEIQRIHNSHANPSLRSFKLLGIHFDEHLNFNANTNALISKVSRSIFFITRVKHTLTPKALKSLYTSFFQLSSTLLHQYIHTHLTNKHQQNIHATKESH